MFNALTLKIRQIRLMKGLSQDYVSLKLGISQSAYSKIERNEIKIDLERLYKIAEVLEMDFIDLIYFDEKKIFQVESYSRSNLLNPNKQLFPILSYEQRFANLEKEISSLKSSISLNLVEF